jgi:thiamine kinase-like enzyme
LKHKQAYLQLIENYKDLPLVLSHNDLSADNLIYTNQHQVIFIDYEWSRLNNVYWDVANFIREVNLPIVAIKYLCKALKINLQSLLVFVYLCTNYAYQWTFNMLQTKKIKLYRQQIFKKLEHYYQLAKIGEYTHL